MGLYSPFNYKTWNYFHMYESQYRCHSLENKHSQNVTDMEAGCSQGKKEGRNEKMN